MALREVTCPYGACDGSGLVVDEATNTAFDCRCRAEQIQVRRYRQSVNEIPRRYRDVALERRPICEFPAQALGALKGYLAELPERIDAGQGLWFYGPPGGGKTCAAALIAMHVKGTSALWPGQRLLERIKHTFREDAQISTWEFTERLIELDLLIIDDLAATNPTPWALEQLYVIIDERYRNLAPVVITTDQTVDELEQHLGDHGPRLIRRLGEMCGAPIEIPLT